MEMPRSGLAAATTGTPAACSRSMTPAQLELSANAPCTSTTVNEEGDVVSDMVMAPCSRISSSPSSPGSDIAPGGHPGPALVPGWAPTGTTARDPDGRL